MCKKLDLRVVLVIGGILYISGWFIPAFTDDKWLYVIISSIPKAYGFCNQLIIIFLI